jgi:hypothetical protein
MSRFSEMIMEKPVEFLPLLVASQAQMASRRLLHEYGVTDTMIDAAEQRGEVVTSGPGPFDSVILTEDGVKLYPVPR